MKNILLLIVCAVSFLSCSNDDASTSPAPSLRLEKLVVFKNTPNEQTWNFNEKGLLFECLNSAGLRLESYTYNDQNQVISLIVYSNGVISSTYTFEYSTEGKLVKINTNTVIFNPNTNQYTYTENGVSREITMNTNSIATSIKETQGSSQVNYQMIYNEENLVSFARTSSQSNFTKNFSYNNSATYKTNLGSLIAPVSFVKSFLQPDFFANGFTSTFVPETCQHGNPAALRYEYGVLTGSRSLVFMSEEYINNSPGAMTSYQEYYYAN